jgi:hypothetical protein
MSKTTYNGDCMAVTGTACKVPWCISESCKKVSEMKELILVSGKIPSRRQL